jgi:hypothetical protein
MGEVAEIFSMTKNTKSLKTYLAPSKGNWTFEVKDQVRREFCIKASPFKKHELSTRNCVATNSVWSLCPILHVDRESAQLIN